MLASNYGYFDTDLCKRQIENIDKSSIFPVQMICMEFKSGLKDLERKIVDKEIKRNG